MTSVRFWKSILGIYQNKLVLQVLDLQDKCVLYITEQVGSNMWLSCIKILCQ